MDEDVTIQTVEFVTTLTNNDIRVLEVRTHFLFTTVAMKPDFILLICEKSMNSFPTIVANKFVKFLLVHIFH